MECKCETCCRACQYKPGWFMPEDIEPLAKFLNMTVEECFKQFLAVDWFESEDSGPDIFVLSPATVKMSPGTEFPADPRGACIFFKDGLCSIYPARPYECRFYDHTMSFEVAMSLRAKIPEAWKDKQEVIEKLLGRKPESQPFSMLDAMMFNHL